MATKTKAKKTTAKKKSAVKPAAGRARPAASRPAAHRPAPPVRDARPEKKLEKKPVRRPALPDLEIDPDVLEFIAAIDRFKKEQVRPFPTWSEILHILRELGYRKR